jgi:PAS domain-containing protein
MKKFSAKQFLLINIIVCLVFLKAIDWSFSYNRNKVNEITSYQLLNDEIKYKVSQSIYLFQNWLLGSEKINVTDQVFDELKSIQKELRAAIEGEECKYFLNKKYSVKDKDLNDNLLQSYNNINSISEIIQLKYNYQIVNLKRHRKSVKRSEELEKKYVESFERIFKDLFLTFEHTEENIMIISRDYQYHTSLLKYLILLILTVVFVYFTSKVFLNQNKKQRSSLKLKKLISAESERMDKLTKYVTSIKNSNFKEYLDINTKDDEFAQSIVDLKSMLRESAEEERKQSEENIKRNWITQGLTWASDVLRDSYEGVEDLSYNIISGLVKYMDANQGGLFILNEDDAENGNVFLELTGAYAYEQRKYLIKKINIGEGLVGMCFQEGKTVHLTEVPKDYVKITSGMGESTPTVLLIVPLIFDEKCFGVIEMASFNNVEKHQIEFLENVGESIASTISSARINQRTAYLLSQSNKQAEEMKAQEEEMRQNMEEMQATQEEASRREAELKSMLMAVNFSNIVVEYDLEGNIIAANDSFADVLNKPATTIIGDNHKSYSSLFIEDRDAYLRFWNKILHGERQKVVSKLELENGNVVTLIENFSPIYDQNNHVVKIVNFASNTTNEDQ